jgi:serine/threonine protein kinase
LELCDTGDLSVFLRRCGPISESFVREIGLQIVEAIKHLRQHDIVHRDIKPANFLLQTIATRLDGSKRLEEAETQSKAVRKVLLPGQRFVVKLADFGLAKHLALSGTSGAWCGSQGYMVCTQ